MGIINHITPEDGAFDKAWQLAQDMVSASSVSVHYTKAAINRTYETMGLRAALQTGLDLDIMLNSTPSPEKQEFARIRKEHGVKAAIAWRDARFKPSDT